MGWMIKKTQNNKRITAAALLYLSSIRKSEKNIALHHFYEATFLDLQFI